MRVKDLNTFKTFRFVDLKLSDEVVSFEECRRAIGRVLNSDLAIMKQDPEKYLFTFVDILSVYNYLVLDTSAVGIGLFSDFHLQAMGILAASQNDTAVLMSELIFLRRLIVDNIEGTEMFE